MLFLKKLSDGNYQCLSDCNGSQTHNHLVFKRTNNLAKLDRYSSSEAATQRCSENMQQNYRRTPMPKCDFNKVAKRPY